ncbi:GNAT family N-acetyltransferase [Kocuria sp. HSID16901]|uniref:GNAT family N-acetyltransferase n=1 Tax=Kocuria sp. HSID16901 TaxID=2419505 RepID=UPI00065FAD00|nr:GNAT family protein [Kocuria sp. HSID16901]MCT1367690.1 GNAT family N-acetyltransferase [Rothia sp. p3-SID1597]
MTQSRQQTTIRIASTSDAPELAAILRMDRAALKPFEPTRRDSYFTQEEQSRLLHESLANYEAGTEAPFVIESRGEIVGRFQLNGITRGPCNPAPSATGFEAIAGAKATQRVPSAPRYKPHSSTSGFTVFRPKP